MGKQDEFRHVNYSWDDALADTLDPVERLVYRSNIRGDDQRITNTGGGNTSAKLTERDQLTGEDVEVLWVKGSGGDLRTSTRENFSSLYRDKLVALQGIYGSAEPKGVKTPIEGAMVGMYPHTQDQRAGPCERDRSLQHGPAAQECHRPLAGPAVSQHIGKPGGVFDVRGADADGQSRASLQRGH